ncbi:MAG TPA: biotin-dependent carboxyltransferase family protein [Victivallales bacterium]|nr:biotin-dependent carboxyltransferase family protein [Victivallales bacterium]
MNIFKVIKPGLYSTIQDSGRYGFQQNGVVISGAMDQFAYKTSNILLGNNPNSASLEITMQGPEFIAIKTTVISICGANISPSVDGKPVDLWKTFKIEKDQVLAFGRPINGIRAYISVSGGFDIPRTLGSSSTYVKGKIGGFGRTLIKGDILSANTPLNSKIGVGVSRYYIPDYNSEVKIRVITGPDLDSFTKLGIKTFFQSEYKISNSADRMGYRLEGPSIKHKQGADIISGAANTGTIQVPEDGKPIILMSDHQTTGGYTRIANVISVDIPLIAQKHPGQNICFEETSVNEAQILYRQESEYLNFLNKWINSDF